MRAASAVLFDVGETLVDETRQWEGWARFLGVPPAWFFAALGAVIERGEDHTEVFALLGHPGFDLVAARRQRLDAGDPDEFDERDLHPDARPCLESVAGAGLAVGIAANQPAHREPVVRRLFPAASDVVLSGTVGVAKPDPAFFTAALDRLGVADPSSVLYVGDRVDNDVLPALAAGMRAVHLRRGPWGVVQAAWPEAARATARVGGLDEVVALALGASGR